MLQREFYLYFMNRPLSSSHKACVSLGCRWMRGWAKSNLSMASLARSGCLHRTATRPGQQALWPCRILIRWADRVSVRVNGLEMVVPLEGVVVKH